MYIEGLSRYYLFRKKKSLTYSERVIVTLVIQHATDMRHVVICGLSGSTIFFYIILYSKAQFSGKMLLNINCVF